MQIQSKMCIDTVVVVGHLSRYLEHLEAGFAEMDQHLLLGARKDSPLKIFYFRGVWCLPTWKERVNLKEGEESTMVKRYCNGLLFEANQCRETWNLAVSEYRVQEHLRSSCPYYLI